MLNRLFKSLIIAKHLFKWSNSRPEDFFAPNPTERLIQRWLQNDNAFYSHHAICVCLHTGIYMYIDFWNAQEQKQSDDYVPHRKLSFDHVGRAIAICLNTHTQQTLPFSPDIEMKNEQRNLCANDLYLRISNIDTDHFIWLNVYILDFNVTIQPFENHIIDLYFSHE